MHVHRKALIAVIVLVLCSLLLHATYAQEDRFIAHAKAFLASPEGGGEQNALSNYLRAMEQFDIQAYRQHQQTFDRILQHGWTGRETNEINTLRSLQPILNEIWRGNEKEFIKYPPIESPGSPILNFLELQTLAKLMVIQALYCEYINRPGYAAEWYRHTLILGQRLCDPNSAIIAKLISIAVESIALKNFQQFLIRQNLTKDMYLKIADNLSSLRASETPFWLVMKTELGLTYNMLKGMEADSNGTIKFPVQKHGEADFILANKDTVLREYELFAQRQEFLLQKDYAAIIKTDFDTLTADMSPFLKALVPNFMEAPVREGYTYARWALTVATAQVLAYRAEKGTLPTSLAALTEIGVTPPKDPFSTGIPKYMLRGNSAFLYSIGPDLIDNGASPDYDPTNGTISSGDIMVTLH